ncbi:DNA polymerase [Terracoccus sp. 273MFTsu3.1]|uniref:DNA polymerase n=1 Tax=Terracoccus sp. 273MFTsu3.1 TaxID=1172188 RepID=UPI0003751E00|nr:DNA polymerase [Terracoccus sp. 273MFTsu3.1]
MARFSSNTILTPDRLVEVVDYFKQFPDMVVDFETTGPNRGTPHLAPVVWTILSTHGRTVTIPTGHPNGNVLISRATKKKDPETKKFRNIPAVYDAPPPQMRPSVAWEIMAPLFTNENRILYAHNATFDFPTAAKYLDGNLPAGSLRDTIVIQWLLDENRNQYGLKPLVEHYFGHKYDSEGVGKCVEAHPFWKVHRYGYLDGAYTWHLKQGLEPRLAKFNLQRVYELENEVTRIVSQMRLDGVRVNEPELDRLHAQYSDELVDLEANCYRAAGKEFNLNSVPQKQAILFDPKKKGGQGLKVMKKTKTGGASTDAEALDHHAANPVVKALTEYTDVQKLQSTYIEGYTGVEGDPKKPRQIFDGRVHAELLQYGTVTGRFSCRAPNLQNIPRPSTEKGKQIRGLFMSDPGEKLVVADYGQIELVVLAHYARAYAFDGRGALVDGFEAGIDAHTLTASKVYAVPFDEVVPPMRQTSKGINFAVVYGAGPDKVAAMADTSVEKAKGFLKIHQQEFPEVYVFKDAVLELARSRKPVPYITTLAGRRRRLPGLNYSDKSLRGLAERQAINSLIQGSAADLIKTAMVRLTKTLPSHSSLILSVHDELVVRTPESEAEATQEIMREAMLGEGIAKMLSVPMTSDSKIVDVWAEAK